MGRFRKPSDHDEECQEDIRYLNKDIPLSKSTLSSKDEQSFAPSEAKAINRKAVIETQEVHSSSGHDEDMDHDEDEIVPIYADDKPSRGVKDALILRRGRGGFYWILARPSWVRLLSDWSVRITIVIALIIGVQTTIRIQWESGFDAGYLDAEENIFGIPTQALEGVACQQLGTTDEDCADANKIRQAIQWSRYFLHRGDASSSVQLWEEARSFYRQSMDFGSGVGAQAAIYAARRVQFQSMACQYSRESLKRISRDYAMNPLGDVIEMKQKQRALRALGYYNGEVHNQHTAETRNAIRDFQADIWFDQNGVLSAEQTVLLICGGAQIANDISSQNVLGIMFAAG
ncbi:MAG: peptidoglycan-binding domain-containing protein, partial [Pseudomonadota bacterium]